MKRTPNLSTTCRVIGLEASPCTLCTNKDKTRIAVAGRKVFKIVDAEHDDFTVVNDLRDLPGKQLNLNYCSNHVQWNPKDESQLASAPTNGSVVIWNLNKNTKSKLAFVYDKIHERACNRICYHPKEANILISGSQDSKMVIVDTRTKTSVSTFQGPDSVRDVQFSPFNDNLIIAAFDSGTCQIWDRRNADTSRRSVHAHMGPAYSCAWHPEMENRFLSAGRDKTIKVFDIQSGDKPKEVYAIGTLLSVAHAGWRPYHKNHITSCSHLFDSTLAVWDIRRPFIQYASFIDHTDDVTDFLWLNEEVLLSCAKDCRLIQRHVNSAIHQTDRAAPVSVSLRPDGRGLALSSSDSLSSQKGKTSYQSQSTSRNPAQFRKQDKDPYQQFFLKHTSFLQEHGQKQLNEDDWISVFKCCAKNFMFEGLPTDKLCDHNYQVCMEINKREVAQCWITLKLLLCGMTPGCSTLGLLQTTGSIDCEGESLVNNVNSTNSVEKEKSDNENESNDKKKGSLEDEDKHDIAGMLEFFEQCEDVDNDSIATESSTQPELELPKEPFQLRQDIDTKSHLLDVPESLISGTGSLVSGTSLPQSPIPFSVSSTHSPGFSHNEIVWDYRSQVTTMLKYYAEKGDVQTSVTILLVFGTNIVKNVDKELLVQWFMSYIELLQQFQLLSIAALVINRCPIKEVNEMSQQSTHFAIGCGRCNKLLPHQASSCQKCDTNLSICSVCHTNVRGLFSWCDICGHGGHYKHLSNWFDNNQLCPAGCGHNCIR